MILGFTFDKSGLFKHVLVYAYIPIISHYLYFYLPTDIFVSFTSVWIKSTTFSWSFRSELFPSISIFVYNLLFHFLQRNTLYKPNSKLRRKRNEQRKSQKKQTRRSDENVREEGSKDLEVKKLFIRSRLVVVSRTTKLDSTFPHFLHCTIHTYTLRGSFL